MRIAIALVLALGMAPVAARAEPPHTHEILVERPSGFWTSNRPSVGGAYRYRLLGLGTMIALLTGALTWRLVRRTPARTADAIRRARSSS